MRDRHLYPLLIYLSCIARWDHAQEVLTKNMVYEYVARSEAFNDLLSAQHVLRPEVDEVEYLGNVLLRNHHTLLHPLHTVMDYVFCLQWLTTQGASVSWGSTMVWLL